MTALLLAVDVGTSVARAGLFATSGRLLHVATGEFELLRPGDRQAVHRMDAIWNAVGAAIRACLGAVPGGASGVVGLGFDAAPSLVLSHDGPAPLEGGADVFCRLDHRAEDEAREITATGDTWLRHLGGTLSAESHLAKLLWLKRRAPGSWARVTAVRDLCDELGRRATGIDVHSLGALAACWPYLAQDEAEGGWRHALLERLDLLDVWTMGRLSDPPRPVGQVHGRLSAEAATALGLPAGIAVATGLTDAQAGMLGALGRAARDRTERTLVLVGDTGNAFMAITREERFIPGIAGPFRDAVFPGFWLHQGGQPCTGSALDAVLEQHSGGPHIATPEVHADVAAEILGLLAREGPGFAAQRHIVPDYLGNRAPLGEPGLWALATGLGEELGWRAFLEAYYATARAVVLQARQIVTHMNRHGYAIGRVALSGRHAGNPLLWALYRDALGVEVMRTDTTEPVLLGTAVAAGVAAGVHPGLFAAIDRMTPSQLRHAADPGWRRAHEAAYRIYLKLFDIRNVIAEEAERLGRPAG